MTEAHEDLHHLCELASALASSVPQHPRSGSPRDAETLAAAGGEAGAGRARLLDKLALEGQLLIGQLTLFVDGLADLFAASLSRDREVNTPTVSVVVRAALEVAGQAAWLFADTIDGDERARRLLLWRFADLKTQMLLLRDLRAEGDHLATVTAELDADERALLELVESAGWVAKASVHKENGSLEPAALLDAKGKPEKMPTYGVLVGHVSSTPSIYGMLSLATHSSRFAGYYGLEVAGTPDDMAPPVAQISGFGLPPNLAISFAALAIDSACRSLAGWNGVAASELHAAVVGLMQRAGIPAA